MDMMRVAGALAAMALSAALGACGASRTSTNSQASAGTTAATTTRGGLSRGELAARANAVCSAAKARTPPFKAPAQASGARMAAEIGKVLPIYEQQTKAFQALAPAADVASDWRAFVAAQVALYQMFQGFKRQLDANRPIGPADRGKFDPVIQRLVETAGRIGFTCASG